MMDDPGGSGREKVFPWRWREEEFWLVVEEETEERGDAARAESSR